MFLKALYIILLLDVAVIAAMIGFRHQWSPVKLLCLAIASVALAAMVAQVLG